MAQERRTIQVKLADGTLSPKFPADMPPDQIRAEVARLNGGEPEAESGFRSAVRLALDQNPLMQVGKVVGGRNPVDYFPTDGSGPDVQGAGADVLRGVGTAASLTPGLGLVPTLMRVLGGSLPMVGAAALDDTGEEGSWGAGSESILQGGVSALGEGLSRIPIKPAIRAAGLFTGPMSSARKAGPGVYRDQVDSIAREFDRTGLPPGANLEKLKVTQKLANSDIDARLRELDAYTDPKTGKGTAFNLPEIFMDQAQGYLGRVGESSSEAVKEGMRASEQGGEFVADFLARGGNVALREKDLVKQTIQKPIQRILQGSPQPGGEWADIIDYMQSVGMNPTNTLPSEARPILSNMTEDIGNRLAARGAGKKVPSFGEEALLNDLYTGGRKALSEIDPGGAMGETTQSIDELMARYTDLKNAQKYSEAVRRDPAFPAMRAGMGAGVGGGLGLLFGGFPGAAAGSAIGGVAAPVAMEPSMLFKLLGTGPRAAGRNLPPAFRGLQYGYNTRMREPGEEE